jgi:hypothetical protein
MWDARRFIERQEKPLVIRQALVDALRSRPLLAISEMNRVLPLQPVLGDGEALRLHPQDGALLGVSFGGDRLLLHLPLSGAAVRELSLPRPCSDITSTLPTLTPQQLVTSALQGEPLGLHPLDWMALSLAPWELGEPPAVHPMKLPMAVLGMGLAKLELSVRATGCLKAAGFATMGELLQHTSEDLLSLRNFGETDLKEVRGKLAERGLKLKGD